MLSVCTIFLYFCRFIDVIFVILQNIPNPSLNHGPSYQLNPNYHQSQHMEYPQQPHLGQPQHNQQFVNQQQMNQQQFQQPQQQYQQQQHQQPPQQQQHQQQAVPQNVVPQQPIKTEQKFKEPQDQQPPLQQYAPGQQQYQAINTDPVKSQNSGRLNDVNSNKMLKNQKENHGKTGHVNKNQ